MCLRVVGWFLWLFGYWGYASIRKLIRDISVFAPCFVIDDVMRDLCFFVYVKLSEDSLFCFFLFWGYSVRTWIYQLLQKVFLFFFLVSSLNSSIGHFQVVMLWMRKSKHLWLVSVFIVIWTLSKSWIKLQQLSNALLVKNK